MLYAAAFAAALVGLAIGSFLAVVVLRLPKRRPIAMARSACPHCAHQLGPAELIPLISWLIQRGRCRACGAGIAAFYPAMELAAAAVAAGSIFWIPWPISVAACIAGWAVLTLAVMAARRSVDQL